MFRLIVGYLVELFDGASPRMTSPEHLRRENSGGVTRSELVNGKVSRDTCGRLVNCLSSGMSDEFGTLERSKTRHSLDGIAYRASRPEHTDLGTSAVASRKQPGRFNNEEISALYLWRDAPTAVDEFRSIENGHGGQSCVVSIVQFALIRVVDLTDHATREWWRVKVADFVSVNMARCREVAAAAAARGWEAIQWPSTTGRDSCLAVFLELLSPKSTVQLLRVIEPPQAR